ncbi:MAG: biotin/lipoyl-binding protein [Pseudomonadota bacterium]
MISPQPASGPSLPELRQDLQISPGAPLVSGAPTWVIYDPIRHKFFQIGQRTIEILSRWSAGNASMLRDRLLKERALQVGEDELEKLISFLRQHNLVAQANAGAAASMYGQERRNNILTPLRLFQKMVFFRMPLVRPQSFLEATLPLVAPLMTRQFVWLTGAVLLLALYLAGRQYSELLDHVRMAFSPSGILTYAVAIMVLKMLHELGHAYQTVRLGLRVPVMGVAFMVMFPLFYSDVSDSWRLRKRRDKVMIDAGGMMVEMTVAVYATLLWCFLPDGTLRTAAFAVATSGWVISLIINLNPFMRFDGYYLLADALGIQNLQTRAFAMGRWAMRRGLFGLSNSAPEVPGNAMARFMISYAFAIWVYRFFLFLSIALLLYTFVFKALGVLFLLAALLVFIGKPVLAEIKVWFDMRKEIVKSPRSWISLGLLLSGLAILFWPTPNQITVPAVLEYERQHLIFPPADAQLAEVLITEGMQVKRGDVLLRYTDPELPIKLEMSETRMAMYDSRLLSGAGDAVERGQRVTLERLRDEERETLQALKDREAALVVRAAGSGVVKELATDLQPGMWAEQKKLVGRIVASGGFVVRGLIGEADRERLDDSKPGRFIADDVLLPTIALPEIVISDYSVDRLPDGFFASKYGGIVQVEPDTSGQLIPKGVWYPLNVKVEASALGETRHVTVANRGTVALSSQPESFAQRLVRQVAQVLVRESGF